MRDLKREWELEAAARQVEPARVTDYSKRFHEILAESLKEWMDAKKT